MFAASFLMSSLSLDATDRGKQVLAIGVGGGTVSMGLHDMKPYVNVTAVEIDELVVKIGFKWFGVKDSKYHHTVLQDGVNYLKESAVQGNIPPNRPPNSLSYSLLTPYIFMVVVCVPYRMRRGSRTRALNNTLAEIASRLKLKDALHNFYVIPLDAAE
ncbi:hypothetical protein GCK32_020868 [Trichostrongylus colubriformis]|uniref:Uncharacterized protein n=1 Tax=Trichostrongylus colubriformis TaxID=6319 RepID=A0AAN8IG10_TRICO